MVTPLASIIVPSFNQGRFIRETIESCLAQDYRPIEVVVIDGASTDGTIDILHSYDSAPEVRWVSERDSGVVEAVNKGFAMARGEFAGIQSSDDYYLPKAVRRGVHALRRDPGLGFVFGDIVKVDADGRELSRYALRPFSIANVLSVQTWIPQPSCFFRLALARQLGGWREEVPYAADTDLWFRMMLHAGARKVDRFLAKRRMHPDQRDVHGDRIIRDYTKAVDDWFGRFDGPAQYHGAARAGLLLMRNRYGSGESRDVIDQRMHEAVRLYPPLRPYLFPARAFPGWWRLRSALRRVRWALQR